VTLESDLISWLEQHLPPSPRLAVGLGDDAAVLAACQQSEQLVVTTDMLTDEVDFLIDEVEPEQIGHKALGVNLSDLAAMAARPLAVFVSLALPRQGVGSRGIGLPGVTRLSPLDLAIGLYRGMLPLAEQLESTIAGGDTNSWEGPLAISITAIGATTAAGPLTRSRGKVGDQLLVTGQLGGSILGRHLLVEPRVREAILLHEQYELHAAIDISDGLALDTSRLAKASGLGAVLDLAALPLSAAAHQLSAVDGHSALEHALGDGEDFELVLAVSGEEAERLLRDQPLGVAITKIGELTQQLGLWQLDVDGIPTPLEPLGYQHGGEP